jgi:hypothetical protein
VETAPRNHNPGSFKVCAIGRRIFAVVVALEQKLANAGQKKETVEQ